MKIKNINIDKNKKRNIAIIGGLLFTIIGGIGLYNNFNTPKKLESQELMRSEKKKLDDENIDNGVDVYSINIEDAGKIDNNKNSTTNSTVNNGNIKSEVKNKAVNDLNSTTNKAEKKVEISKEIIQKQTKPKEIPKTSNEYPEHQNEYKPGEIPGYDNVNTDDVDESGVIWEQVNPGGDWNNQVGR